MSFKNITHDLLAFQDHLFFITSLNNGCLRSFKIRGSSAKCMRVQSYYGRFYFKVKNEKKSCEGWVKLFTLSF